MLELPEDHIAREPGRLLGAFLELPDAVVGAFLELPDAVVGAFLELPDAVVGAFLELERPGAVMVVSGAVPGAALEPRGGSSVRSDARDGASALDACVDVKSSHPATAIISSAVPRGSADVSVPQGSADVSVPQGSADVSVPQGSADGSVPQGSAEVSAPHLTALTGTPPPSTLPQPKPSAAMSPSQSPSQSPASKSHRRLGSKGLPNKEAPLKGAPNKEAALAELQAAFPQLRVTKLGRFLKASNGDLAHAKACLTKHVAWLGSLPVDLRTAALPELRKGKLYLRGQDRLGREMLIWQVIAQ